MSFDNLDGLLFPSTLRSITKVEESAELSSDKNSYDLYLPIALYKRCVIKFPSKLMLNMYLPEMCKELFLSHIIVILVF